jgi:ribosomal protein S18 acetylase RimI-like enzyme
MNNFRFETVNGEPEPEDKKVLVDGLLSHHAKSGHPRKSEILSIWLKDPGGKTFGGVIVSFLWNGMEIQALWVDESIRHQGWGTKLMIAVETEGRKRGCTVAYTNTFTWQAPGFYQKLGYILYGKLDDFPNGNTLSYIKKNL